MEVSELQQWVHNVAKSKGWWDEERNNATLIALMHSELSEALEADREGNMNGKDGIAEELADTVIRIMDFCEYNDMDLEHAIIEKTKYNEGRDYKHGGKEY